MTRAPHAFRRRALLGGGGALFAWAFAPKASSAAGQHLEERRLLTVLLRGGLDGLAAVPAIGDPAFAALRATNRQQEDELREGSLPLPGIYALNRHLGGLHALFAAGEATILHAVATPSRDRSHFAAQDVLESGLNLASGTTARSGWLNRALQGMAPGERLRPGGFAVAPTIPLIMRGTAPVDTWQPQVFRTADVDTFERLRLLYAARDPVLEAALTRGGATDALLGTAGDMTGARPGGRAVAETVNAIVRLMARADGPRIAAMNLDGWDTHIGQGYGRGRIARQLATLDSVIAALRDGLAPVWPHTAVLIVTEFGRTVRINGSAGTDHGTGTVALLLGGAVRGGHVVGDWPGLAPERLFEARDLAPTTDLRAVFKGVLADHLGVASRALEEDVFPGSAMAPALRGLLRTG